MKKKEKVRLLKTRKNTFNTHIGSTYGEEWFRKDVYAVYHFQ